MRNDLYILYPTLSFLASYYLNIFKFHYRYFWADASNDNDIELKVTIGTFEETIYIKRNKKSMSVPGN